MKNLLYRFLRDFSHMIVVGIIILSMSMITLGPYVILKSLLIFTLLFFIILSIEAGFTKIADKLSIWADNKIKNKEKA